MAAAGWEWGRWWTVLYADGRTDHPGGLPAVWCQTSDEGEARRALETCPGGGELYRQQVRREFRLVRVA